MTVYVNGVDLATYYFHYSPNRALCIVSIVVFGFLFVLLTARVLRTRSPKFILLLPLTALVEMIGFVLRYICAENPTTSVYSAMNVLLLLAANIMALVNYKAVADVVRLSGVETRCIIIGPNLRKLLFRSNLIASILQAVGSGMTSSASTRNTGFIIALIGLIVNIVAFGGFLFIIYYVDSRPEYDYQLNGKKSPKHKLMVVMYATMGLLFARSVYRLATYIISYHFTSEIEEWTFYAFDVLLIALCFIIHFIWFIGRYLPHFGAEFNSSSINNNNYDMSQQQGTTGLTPQQKSAQQQQEYVQSNAAYNA